MRRMTLRKKRHKAKIANCLRRALKWFSDASSNLVKFRKFQKKMMSTNNKLVSPKGSALGSPNGSFRMTNGLMNNGNGIF